MQHRVTRTQGSFAGLPTRFRTPTTEPARCGSDAAQCTVQSHAPGWARCPSAVRVAEAHDTHTHTHAHTHTHTLTVPSDSVYPEATECLAHSDSMGSRAVLLQCRALSGAHQTCLPVAPSATGRVPSCPCTASRQQYASTLPAIAYASTLPSVLPRPGMALHVLVRMLSWGGRTTSCCPCGACSRT
jgi:hypothetical protein